METEVFIISNRFTELKMCIVQIVIKKKYLQGNRF